MQIVTGHHSEYLQNITIPSALIEKAFGDKLKVAINKGDMYYGQY
jgi:hypothetical protein